jgi:hypothetical protein
MSAGVLGSAVDWKAGKAELCAFAAFCTHLSFAVPISRVLTKRYRLRLAGFNPDPQWGFNLTRLSAQLEEDGYAMVDSEFLP